MTNKHIILADYTLTWIINRATRKGIRGAREVAIPGFYVADVLCLCSLQNRFFESYTSYAKCNLNYFACIFQIKVSRSDYWKDFSPKGNHAMPGNLHWCVIPKNLIKSSELPDGWGLLVESGNGLSELKKASFNTDLLCSYGTFAENILWAIGKKRVKPKFTADLH